MFHPAATKRAMSKKQEPIEIPTPAIPKKRYNKGGYLNTEISEYH